MKFRFIFVLAISVFSITSLISQAVNGTFTIGKEGKDFTTFTESISFLQERGINGDVELIVDPGDYEEQIKINEIEGSGPSGTISFRSSTGNNEDVLLHHEHQGSSTNTNYTVYIDGADYITFSNITIQADPDQPEANDKNRVIYITGASDYITFRNNIIKSFFTTRNYFESNDCVVVGSDYNTSKKNNYFTFVNNTVIGGASGLNLSGSSSAGDYGTTDWYIKNNTFIDQSKVGISAWIAKNLTIEDNKITASENSYRSWVGLEINQATGDILVNRNNITSLSNGSGMFVSYLDNVFATGTKLISNNSIVLNAKLDVNFNFGIQSSFNENLVIAHNCIYQDENNAESVLYYSQSTNADIDSTIFVNNHLFQASKGVCFRYNSPMIQTPFQDYNNYYSPNGGMAIIGADTIKTFADIQEEGYDPNSSYYDPKYARFDFLVPTNNQVFNTGTPTIVSQDKFGNSRSSTNPDIGIYEGDVADYDVGIISFLSQNAYDCDFADVINIKIKNYAQEILTSATIRISNSEGDIFSYPWAGSLQEGEESEPIIVDDLILPSDETLTAWTELPNQKVDIFTINDTLRFNYVRALSGAYSVGDETADYIDLNTAVNDLVTRGICGPVELNILPGTYEEKIFIPEISGTSSSNTVTIQSMSKDSTSVIFESYNQSGQNYTFKIVGTDHIHLKYMTLRVLNVNGDSNIIVLTGNSTDCSFSDLALSSTSSSGNFSTASSRSLILVSQSQMKNLLIENCNFYKGTQQISLMGGNSNSTAENIVIRNNTFEDRSNISIFLDDLQNATITDNIFTGYQSDSGIRLVDCHGPIQIIKNRLYLSNGFAITLDRLITMPDFPLLISNNFMTTPRTSMNISTCSNTRIFHNNFNIINTGNAFRMGVNSWFESLEFANNIINMQESNIAYFLFGAIDENTDITVDNNVIYSHTEDEILIEIEDDVISLEDWQSVFQNDQNSIITHPKYISDDDLHLYNTVALDGKGLAGTGIATDIDGEIRDQISPDIGADEITIDPFLIKDLSIESVVEPSLSSCDLANSMEIMIKNNAISPVDSFSIVYSLFGRESQPIKVIRRIEPGEVISHKMVDYGFIPNTLYQLEMEILAPDGEIDDFNNNNDTDHQYHRILNVSILEKEDDCEETTNIFVPKYFETEVLWSTGEISNKIEGAAPGIYSVTLTTADGCEVSNTINIE